MRIQLTDETGAVIAEGEGAQLLKAHVSGYTRKDGAYVNEHEDKRAGKNAYAKKQAEMAAQAKEQLGDRPDFKGMLGDLGEGETHHFQNSRYAAEKFGVQRKGDRYHLTGVASKFGDHPEGGYTADKMAERLHKWHGHMGEKLIHTGKVAAAEEGEAPKGEERGEEKPMRKAMILWGSPILR